MTEPVKPEEPTPEEEEAAFAAKVNALLHKALGERDKRLEAKITKMMETTVGARFDEIRTLLVETPDETDKAKPEDKPGEKSSTQRLSPEDQAAIKQAKADAAEARKKAEQWEQRAREQETANKRGEERQLLMAALQGKVKPAMLDMLVDQLHAKQVTRDEETGAILWKDTDGTLVPAKDGVTGWLKSDVGKEFAPARAAGGGGGRGGEDVPTKPGSMTLDGLGDLLSQKMAR
jgi:hypothetical protein